MTDISKSIRAINPTAQFSVNSEDYAQITWMDGTTPISEADIRAKQTELQTEYNSLSYARAREEAYPQLQEFTEAYCEKEIGEDSTKWDAYVVKYNKVRSDNQKP